MEAIRSTRQSSEALGSPQEHSEADFANLLDDAVVEGSLLEPAPQPPVLARGDAELEAQLVQRQQLVRRRREELHLRRHVRALENAERSRLWKGRCKGTVQGRWLVRERRHHPAGE